MVACHNDFPAGKFFGKCNAAKAELDHCFRVRRCHTHDPPALPPGPAGRNAMLRVWSCMCLRSQMEKRMRRATNADRRRVSASAMLKDIEAREAGLGSKP